MTEAPYFLHMLVGVLQGDIHLVVEYGCNQHQVIEIVGLGSLACHSQMDLWMAFLVCESLYMWSVVTGVCVMWMDPEVEIKM